MSLDSEFKPDLTPEQMHMLGVLGPQYYGEDAKKHNFFGVNASQNDWPSKWKDGEAPKGWYQWYAGYANGKRTDDDERQIKRWKSFKARHMGPLRKADPSLKNFDVHTKRRQALLHWGIAPGINPSDYVSTSGVKITPGKLSNPPIPETPMKKKLDKEEKEDQEKSASQVPLRKALDIAQGYSGVRLARNLAKSNDLKNRASRSEGIARRATRKAENVTSFFPGIAAKKQRGLRDISYKHQAEARKLKREASDLRPQIEDDALRTATTGVGAAAGIGTGVYKARNKNQEKQAAMNPYLMKIASFESSIAEAMKNHYQPRVERMDLSPEDRDYYASTSDERHQELNRKAKIRTPVAVGAASALGSIPGIVKSSPSKAAMGAGIGAGLAGLGAAILYNGHGSADEDRTRRETLQRNPILSRILENQDIAHVISASEQSDWDDIEPRLEGSNDPFRTASYDALREKWDEHRYFSSPDIIVNYDKDNRPSRMALVFDRRNTKNPAIS